MADVRNSKYTAQEIESIFDKINKADLPENRNNFVYKILKQSDFTQIYNPYTGRYDTYKYIENLGFRPKIIVTFGAKGYDYIYDYNENPNQYYNYDFASGSDSIQREWINIGDRKDNYEWLTITDTGFELITREISSELRIRGFVVKF